MVFALGKGLTDSGVTTFKSGVVGIKERLAEGGREEVSTSAGEGEPEAQGSSRVTSRGDSAEVALDEGVETWEEPADPVER